MATVQTWPRKALFGAILFCLPAVTNAQAPYWAPTNGPYGGPVKALAMDGVGNVFAASERGIYRSTDHGERWTWISLLRPNKRAFVVDSSGAILAGETGLWRSTDAGMSWEQWALPDQSVGILLVAPDNTIFVGVSGLSKRGLFRSFSTGLSWTRQTSGASSTLTGVSFTGADTGIAVGSGGTILRTTNGGSTWESRISGTTANLCGISFAGADTGIAVGANGTILRTTDGGVTWESQTSGTTAFLSGVSFINTETGTAVGADGTILRTTDGGATWESQTSGTTASLFGVCFTDTNNGTAVGRGGTILRTIDGGTTWASQSSGTVYSLGGVHFTDANCGTVVGTPFDTSWTRGLILRTNDGGTTWASQSSGTTATLYGVSFSDSATGTAVGEGGITLRTHDAGTTWMSIPSGTTGRLNAVVFTDDTNGTAVGDGGTVLRTAPGSVSFVPHGLSGMTVSNLLLSAKHGLLATVGWSSVYRGSTSDTNWVLIGSTSDRAHTFIEDTSGNLYVGRQLNGVDRSTDGGATWQNTGLGQPYTVTSLASLPTGEIYAAIYALDPSIDGGVYRSADAGVTWTSLGLKEWGIYTLLARDQSSVFLGSDRGVFRLATDGDSWEVASEGIAAAENYALLCIDQSALFAGTVAGLFRSTDNGDSWHESGQGIFPPFVTALAYDHSGNLFAGNMVFTTGGGIYKSTDRGMTWKCTTQDSIMGNYIGISAIAVTKTNALVAGVSGPGPNIGKIYRSGDGGETWARVTTPQTVKHIASDSASNIYGATWGYGVLRSTDDGLTWGYTAPGLPNPNIYCVATRDTGEVFAGGIGGVSRSTNAGDSWVHISAPLGNIVAKAIAVDLSGDIIVSTTDKRVFRTTDNGTTWARDTIGVPVSTHKALATSGEPAAGPPIQFISALTGRGARLFAADTLGLVLRYVRSASGEETPDGVVPWRASLEQNYPNPFNPKTGIRYQVPSISDVKLMVYDLLGREVTVLVNERKAPGSYEVKFDASGLASGVYVYRLRAGDFVASKKLLLLK
jgi:photosystem II stability/assembly factor-like uncharacterized protein